MVEGYAYCPQCQRGVFADVYDSQGTETVICDDCGCEFSFDYETNIITKGILWEDDE